MKRERLNWILAAGGVLALVIYFLFPRYDAPLPPPEASNASDEMPEADDAPPPSAKPVTSPKRRPPRAIHPSPAEDNDHDGAPATPECRKDDDCRGPKTAECTETRCKNGKCVYDKKNCECRTSADCDDGDPCTRNHCFVPTMSCIYIPIDGCGEL